MWYLLSATHTCRAAAVPLSAAPAAAATVTAPSNLPREVEMTQTWTKRQSTSPEVVGGVAGAAGVHHVGASADAARWNRIRTMMTAWTDCQLASSLSQVRV